MGRYPFRCDHCGKRFFATRRYPPPKIAPPPPKTEAPGRDMAFRRDEVRPTAQVVIQADDHVQLDRILLALHSAVTSYQQSASRPTAKAGR